MTTLLFMLPWVAMVCGAAMIGRARRLGGNKRRFTTLALAVLALPVLAQAQTVDLKTAVEAGNGIIMYVCGTLVAIGLVSAGIAAGTGRHAIAKWALVGTLISGLAFPIVKTIWGNIGLTPPEVSTFTP